MIDGVRVGLADNWLRHVQDVSEKYSHYLNNVAEPKHRHDRLCELNVIEQVINVGKTTVVRDAWERGQKLTIHGWVYGLADGLLRDLDINIDSTASLEKRYLVVRQQFQSS